jgi:hypothetical protein
MESMTLQTGQFEHRTTYQPPPSGRDRYVVRALESWLDVQLAELCSVLPPSSAVLDVGCAEQPLRKLIESFGLAYRGMDVVQNAQGTVDVVTPIDDELPEPWPDSKPAYSLLLCTEVLEHVRDWQTAFSNLRRLLLTGGRLVLTVPFQFPLHMEPYDYFRATPHSLRHLADIHGFELERCDTLGHPFDVLCTFLADTSILPERATLYSRGKAFGARFCKRMALGVLDSRWARSHLQVNSHAHLTNAAVLRAI